MKIIRFVAANGAHISEAAADRYGRELRRLAVSRGAEGLTPDEIVEAATRRDSPLRDYFDWDNDEAAEKWRKQQARDLCNKIAVEIVMPDGDNFTMPLMESIHVEITGADGSITMGRRYVTVRVLAHDADARQSVTGDAVDRLLSALKTIEDVARLGGEKDATLAQIAKQLKSHIIKIKKAA